MSICNRLPIPVFLSHHLVASPKPFEQKICLILLKILHLLRCFDFLAIATYAKYASFLGNLAPCTCLPQAGLEHFQWNPISGLFAV
jgi:hypothetical protein